MALTFDEALPGVQVQAATGDVFGVIEDSGMMRGVPVAKVRWIRVKADGKFERPAYSWHNIKGLEKA